MKNSIQTMSGKEATKGVAKKTRIKNVIDMALTFTAMIRVFEAGSKQKIAQKLEVVFSGLDEIKDQATFDKLHAEFCEWFINNIKTAKKMKNGVAVKLSAPASYGHAAKVLDISAKVYVHYSHLPSCDAALQLLPLLHGAIDTPILNKLKSDYPKEEVTANSIESIDKNEYVTLQRLISRHIRDKFDGAVFPAQYDDIMWNQLNRGTE